MKMGHFFQYIAGTLFFDIVEARHFKMQSATFKIALRFSGPFLANPLTCVYVIILREVSLLSSVHVSVH